MKYSLTKNKKETIYGVLFQIKAEMSFGSVSKGDLGGWISKEENLSQEDNAWVYGNAWVSGDAEVSGDADVSGNARVYGNAWVYGSAEVSGIAEVYGDARVSGDAEVSGSAEVYSDAWVYGKLKLLSGYFFGTRYQKEEIKYKELDDNYELIYKGDAKFGEDEPKETIKIGEYTYNKNEVETALKDLKTI